MIHYMDKYWAPMYSILVEKNSAIEAWFRKVWFDYYASYTSYAIKDYVDEEDAADVLGVEYMEQYRADLEILFVC